jgi:hypothetical protein
VVFKSPQTVVLGGLVERLERDSPSLVDLDNHVIIWKAVNMIKEKGFAIDSVFILGVSALLYNHVA